MAEPMQPMTYGQRPPPMTREEEMAALNQELNARRQMRYSPWGYGYNPADPYNNAAFNQGYNSPQPQVSNTVPDPQQQAQVTPQEQARPSEYLQGYPIEQIDQLREARVGLDGRVFMFPLFAENSIYTKQTNLDGLPEYKRYILDEDFKSEEFAEASTHPSTTMAVPEELTSVIKDLKDLKAEIATELQALREERRHVPTEPDDAATSASSPAEPVKSNSSTGSNKRSKPDATPAATAQSKPSNATSSGNATADAKGPANAVG